MNFQKKDILKKVKDALWIIKDKQIGILGLSFKPNTDDLRSAPSIEIIKDLQAEGARIRAYDPQAMENSKTMLKDVEYRQNPYDAAKGCDALIILTEWSEFKDIDIAKIKNLMNRPLIIDGRNIFDASHMQSLGIEYVSIGRKN